MDSKTIVICVTAASKAEAETIGQTLLKEKLIACVNMLDGVRSLFWWQGKIDEAAEVLMIMKTTYALFESVQLRVKSLHSYDVPEIIALPIVAGEENYLKWIQDSVAEKP